MSKTPRELVLFGRAERALAETKTIDELQDLRDKAQAAREYARKAKMGQRFVIEASVRLDPTLRGSILAGSTVQSLKK